jgi:hypothetical protein
MVSSRGSSSASVPKQRISLKEQSINPYLKVRGKEGLAGSQTYMFAAEQLIKRSNQSIPKPESEG